MTEEDRPLSPEEMLALLEDQQRSVAGHMGAFVPVIMLAWGIAWLGGFLALLLLPLAAGVWVLVGLAVAAGIVSGVLGARSSRGVRTAPDAAFAGIVYGQAWWISIVGIVVIGQALVHNGMPEDLLRVFLPTLLVFSTGLLLFLGGALWRAVPMVVLGGWLALVGVIAPFTGTSTQYLVHALAGGGAFLAVAAWTWWWSRAARRRTPAAPSRGTSSGSAA